MSYPPVLEAVVVGIPDEKWGERPVSLVVLKDKRGARAVADIIEYLRGLDKFPKWWLPDAIYLVDRIPKTSTGKLDKKQVRLMLAAGVTGEGRVLTGAPSPPAEVRE